MWENISLFYVRISLSRQIHWVALVQEMQANSIIISNYDSLCYVIELKVNKELSLNLLESMLELFITVWMFSLARDIKEKHKVKNKKTKVRSLRTEIKKSSSSKDFNHWILSSIQCSLRPRTLKVGLATYLKLHYLQLKLDDYDQKKIYISIF